MSSSTIGLLCCVVLLNVALHTDMEMPKASHTMKSTPNRRKTAFFRDVGIDCCSPPQVARAFIIVLEGALTQAGGTGKGHGGS